MISYRCRYDWNVIFILCYYYSLQSNNVILYFELLNEEENQLTLFLIFFLFFLYSLPVHLYYLLEINIINYPFLFLFVFLSSEHMYVYL